MRYIDFKRKLFTYKMIISFINFYINEKIEIGEEGILSTPSSEKFSIDSGFDFVDENLINYLSSKSFEIDDINKFLNHLELNFDDVYSVEVESNLGFVNSVNFEGQKPERIEIKSFSEFKNNFDFVFFRTIILESDNVIKFLNDFKIVNSNIKNLLINDKTLFANDFNLFNANTKNIEADNVLRFLEYFQANASKVNPIIIDLIEEFDDYTLFMTLGVFNLIFDNKKIIFSDKTNMIYSKAIAFGKEEKLIIKDENLISITKAVILNFLNMKLIFKDENTVNLLETKNINFNDLTILIDSSLELVKGLSLVLKLDILNRISDYVRLGKMRSLHIKAEEKFKLINQAKFNISKTKVFGFDDSFKLSISNLVEIFIEFLVITSKFRIRDDVRMNLLKRMALKDYDNTMLFNLDNEKLSNLDIKII